MGTKYLQNSIVNQSVIYLRKFCWYFVGAFVGNPSVIDNHFYRYSIGILSVICYEYTLLVFCW